MHLQRHALALDLVDPGVDARSSDFGLLVLVGREADELAVDDRLGLGEVVVVGRDRADDLRALRLEARRQHGQRVAEDVGEAAVVAAAEDGHLLAREVEAREVAVQELVPRGARALRVGARVPRRRADDQTIVRRNRRAVQVANVLLGEARLGRKVAGDGLGVACGTKTRRKGTGR